VYIFKYASYLPILDYFYIGRAGFIGLAGLSGEKGDPGTVIMPEVSLIRGREGPIGDKGFPGIDGTPGPIGKSITILKYLNKIFT